MSKVRKIEPIAKLPETAIKPNITRVAVYARVSTDMEEQATVAEMVFPEKHCEQSAAQVIVSLG